MFHEKFFFKIYRYRSAVYLRSFDETRGGDGMTPRCAPSPRESRIIAGRPTSNHPSSMPFGVSFGASLAAIPATADSPVDQRAP